jgi:hypothetical protein
MLKRLNTRGCPNTFAKSKTKMVLVETFQKEAKKIKPKWILPYCPNTRCRIWPEEEALYDHMAAAQKNAPSHYDCGILTCEKMFPHQHVGVQTKQQDGLIIPEEESVCAMNN